MAVRTETKVVLVDDNDRNEVSVSRRQEVLVAGEARWVVETSGITYASDEDLIEFANVLLALVGAE